MAYALQDMMNMGKQIDLSEMTKARGLQTGRLNPWNLPEYQPLIQGVRNQNALGLQDYAKSLSMANVGGPANALAMERAGEKGNNNVLNLTNTLRGGQQAAIDRGKQLYDQWMQRMAQWKQQNEQQQQAHAQQNMGWAQMGLNAIPMLGNTMSGIGQLFGGGAKPSTPSMTGGQNYSLADPSMQFYGYAV